jgi:hypothetical protein
MVGFLCVAVFAASENGPPLAAAASSSAVSPTTFS